MNMKEYSAVQIILQERMWCKFCGVDLNREEDREWGMRKELVSSAPRGSAGETTENMGTYDGWTSCWQLANIVLFPSVTEMASTESIYWLGRKNHLVMYIEGFLFLFFFKVRKIALFSRTMDLFWLETPWNIRAVMVRSGRSPGSG